MNGWRWSRPTLPHSLLGFTCLITFNSHSGHPNRHYHPHFIDEQMEAQRDWVTSISWQRRETSTDLILKFIFLHSNPQEIYSNAPESGEWCLITYKITKIWPSLFSDAFLHFQNHRNVSLYLLNYRNPNLHNQSNVLLSKPRNCTAAPKVPPPAMGL